MKATTVQRALVALAIAGLIAWSHGAAGQRRSHARGLLPTRASIAIKKTLRRAATPVRRAVWAASGAVWGLLGEGRFFVLDARTAAVKRELHCAGAIEGATFSDDAQLVALAGRKLCVFSLASGGMLGQLDAPSGAPSSVLGFGPNGALLALANGSRLALWDVNGGAPSADPARQRIEGAPDAMHQFAFEPEGRLVATAGALSRQQRPGAAPSKEPIQIWNTGNGRLWSTLHGHRRPIVALAYARGSGDLVSLDESGTALLWPGGNAPARGVGVLDKRGPRAVVLSLTADGTRIALGDEAGRIRVHDRQGIYQPPELVLGVDPVVQLCFARHRPLLAAIDRRGSVRVFDLDSGALRASTVVPDAAIDPLAFLPDGTLAIARDAGAVTQLALEP